MLTEQKVRTAKTITNSNTQVGQEGLLSSSPFSFNLANQLKRAKNKNGRPYRGDVRFQPQPTGRGAWFVTKTDEAAMVEKVYNGFSNKSKAPHFFGKVGAFKQISPLRQVEYERTYNRLMERAKSRKYEKGKYERHHIIPKSLGGGNEKANIVCLTYEEHFLAHRLLTKFTEGEERRNMCYALWRMMSKTDSNPARVTTSWQYALAKKALTEALRNNTYSKGYKHSDEVKAARSEAMRGSKNPSKNPEVAAKISKTKKGQQTGSGNVMSIPEVRAKHLKNLPRGSRNKMYGRKGRNHPVSKPVVEISSGRIFFSIREAAEFFKIKHSTYISAVCKGVQKTVKGLRFRYSNELQLKATA